MRLTDDPTGWFILGCWAVFIIVWALASFFAKRTKKQAAGGNAILVRFGIAVMLMLIVGAHVPLLSVRMWRFSREAGLLADMLAGTGLAVLLWARVSLGGNWSAGVALKEQHELVQYGPYAFVRHPIYSGLILLFLGEAVWFANAMWLLVWGIVVASMYAKARKEEEWMIRHFPDAYSAYRKRSRMLIPFVL